MKQDLMFRRVLFGFELPVGAAAARQAYVPNVRAKRGIVSETDVVPTWSDDSGRFQIVVIAKDERIDGFPFGLAIPFTLNKPGNVHVGSISSLCWRGVNRRDVSVTHPKLHRLPLDLASKISLLSLAFVFVRGKPE